MIVLLAVGAFVAVTLWWFAPSDPKSEHEEENR